MKRLTPILPIIVSLFYFSILQGDAAPRGVFAYVEMRGDKDRMAKVKEFESVVHNLNGYFFRLTSGRQMKV